MTDTERARALLTQWRSETDGEPQYSRLIELIASYGRAERQAVWKEAAQELDRRSKITTNAYASYLLAIIASAFCEQAAKEGQ